MPKRKPPRHRATDDPCWTSELEPAPGELKIVQAFVNTAIPRQGSEELSSPRALGHFLTRWRLMGDDVELGEAELQTGLALREGARALLRANNGAALDRKAVDRFESATARVPMRLRVDTVEGTAYLGPADAGAAALGRLLGIFTAARLGPRGHGSRPAPTRPAARPSTTARRTSAASGARCAAATGSPPGRDVVGSEPLAERQRRPGRDGGPRSSTPWTGPRVSHRDCVRIFRVLILDDISPIRSFRA